jgi:hypothetical protein
MAIDQVSVDECVSLAVYGCTDSTALNYDPAADTDDGSCILPCANSSDNQVTITVDGVPGKVKFLGLCLIVLEL